MTTTKPKVSNLVNFQKGVSGNPKGRPLSFKKRFNEIQEKGGGYIWADTADVKTRTYNKVKQTGFYVEGIDEMIGRLNMMIRSKKNSKLTFDIIKFIWEQQDGKAKQGIEMIDPVTEKYDYDKLTEAEQKTLLALLEKAAV